MPTTNHGAINTPTDAATYDIAGLMLTMAQSLEPGVVGYYANNTARDAGTLALRNAGVKGFKAFVLSPPSGDSPGPDWCGWNGTEWVWETPTPVTYNSSSIAGTSINYTTPSGHSPSVFAFTPTRSGMAEVRLQVAAQSGVAGYGSGFLRMRYSSGTLLPGGSGFTVIEDVPASTRKDTTFLLHPVKIYLTKSVSTSLAFDLWSNVANGTAFWQLVSASWFVTQQ
jgi:hypothetical protein